MSPRSVEGRLAVAGVGLLVIAGILWGLTFLPPGTMTSMALEAMAAVACGGLGLALLGSAFVVKRRS